MCESLPENFDDDLHMKPDAHRAWRWAQQHGIWGYIDPSGKYVINPQFDEAGDFEDGLAPVRIGAKWGYIDKTGKYIWGPSD